MLLNLSNHPASKWPDSQLKAVNKNYGEVQDMPFPVISPQDGIEEVEKLAGKYLKKILQSGGEQMLVVHIMGEMTFTHCLVNKLQAAGIECVASTTRREVIMEEDGRKTSVFEFVRFRPFSNHS